MVTTAVIMAAGLGSRFGKMTETMPKGFIEVGGLSMVIRSIETLISCGIKRIIIGTGYKKEAYEALKEKYPQIECVFSPRYAETNSMYTLWNCREAIGDDDFFLIRRTTGQCTIGIILHIILILELGDWRYQHDVGMRILLKLRDGILTINNI